MVFHAASIRTKYPGAPTLEISRWTWLYGIGLAFGLAGLFDLVFVNPGFHESRTLLVLGGFLASLPFVVYGSVYSVYTSRWLCKRMGQCGVPWSDRYEYSYFSYIPPHFLADLSFPFNDDQKLKENYWWPWLQLLSAFAVTYGITTAVFNNWILAAIAMDNWSGSPSRDSAYTLNEGVR